MEGLYADEAWGDTYYMGPGCKIGVNMSANQPCTMDSAAENFMDRPKAIKLL